MDIEGRLAPAALVEHTVNELSARVDFSSGSAPLPAGSPGARVHGANNASYLVNESPYGSPN